MQYEAMDALIKEAERAGEEETACVNDSLFAAFELWASGYHLEELTTEELDSLYAAFLKGFGICLHNQT